MRLLQCKACGGEMDIVGSERAVNKKVRCRQCNFNNVDTPEKKIPEVVVIRRRSSQD